ncbi:MAG: metallophosphoesterase [Ignavibacteria bacterium]
MPDKTITVIGDIHGCYNTLLSLYKNLKNTNEIYTVGDIIDRGRYSKDVVQFCIDKKIKPVKGNHEDMMIKAIDSSDKFFGFMFKDAELYYHNGGRETQFSYTGSRLFSDFKKFKQEIKELGHYEFLRCLPLKYEFPKVVISHAGIIEGGDDVSILWNRRMPAYLEKLQIFGHTPLQETMHMRNYYSNIDTGCVYENKLTAIIVDTTTGTIEETIQENSNSLDIEQSFTNALK